MKKLTKRKKVLRRDKFSVAMRSLCRYMETRGWKMLVAGPVRVQGSHMGKLGRYELVIDFTGARTRAASLDGKEGDE